MTGTVRNDRGVVVRVRKSCNALLVMARLAYVRRIALRCVFLLTVGSFVAACASASHAGGANDGQSPAESMSPSHADLGSLSPQDYETARNIALHEAEKSARSVTSATATRTAGSVTQSNTGHACTSGSVLHIKLIGEFNIVVSGYPIHQGATATPDFTPHAVVITADPATGEPCLISVQTGTVAPDPGAAVLFTDWP